MKLEYMMVESVTVTHWDSAPTEGDIGFEIKLADAAGNKATFLVEGTEFELPKVGEPYELGFYYCG